MPSFHLAHEQVLSIEPENRDGGINALNCGWGLKMTCKTIAYYSLFTIPRSSADRERREQGFDKRESLWRGEEARRRGGPF